MNPLYLLLIPAIVIVIALTGHLLDDHDRQYRERDDYPVEYKTRA